MQPSPRELRLTLPIVLFSAFLVWLLTRGPLMIGHDFPYNDGGMFAVMIEDLRNNGFRIPTYTTYNNAGIPFGYPPLAFYLGALISSLGVSPIAILCWLPFFFNLLSVLAFASFAWQFWEKKSVALFSAILFPLLPATANWLISGGGLTRSIGFFWSMLAIRFLFLTFRDGNRRDMILAGVFAGLTFISHLESAVFVFLSTLVLSFQGRPWRERLIHLSIIATIAALIVAPWFLLVVSYHGLQPFISAMNSGGRLRSLFIFVASPLMLTGEFRPLVMVLWWIGTIIVLRRREFLLPAWIFVIVMLMWRTPQTQSTAQIALLAGLGLDKILNPSKLSKTPDFSSTQRINNLSIAMLIPSIVIVIGIIFARSWQAVPNKLLERVDKEHRTAMRWIRENISEDTDFLILGPRRSPWWSDREAEWFPAIAKRRSILTTQGTEWLPNDVFNQRRMSAKRLGEAIDFAALQRVVKSSDEAYDAIYLDARGDAKLQKIQRELEARSDFRKIFQGPITIFRRVY
jgi:hypothetical protein